MTCPLCQDKNVHRREDEPSFFSCSHCKTVFKDPTYFLSLKEEKERYLLHENHVEDPRYQQFVTPIVSAVTDAFPSSNEGLDFGAGTGPVISKLLTDQGYNMKLWDPFFHPHSSVLDHAYDFIVCCEVIEHFHHPRKEFSTMFQLLKPNGKLFCMSEILPKNKDFSQWHYKNDPTHVIFYCKENLRWIQESLGFSNVEIDGRLIVFSKA